MTTLPIPPDLAERNTSFSKTLPGFQRAIDSTSLGEFKTCPRKYYYSIIWGLQPAGGNVHLEFGIMMHGVREAYDHARSAGEAHEGALDRALDFALRATWNAKLRRPWISDHPAKTRRGLVQTTVWYLDAMGRDDNFSTLQLASGKPAVEVSFRFDSGARTADGEEVLFCGHLDRIAEMSGQVYILDIKTASAEPNAHWAKQFTPGNQFSMYTLAGRVAFGYDIRNVVVDGVQIGVGFSRFQRHLIPRDTGMLEEWVEDAHRVVGEMEQAATDSYWRMNDKACSMYGGCPFQLLCAKSPTARTQYMRAAYGQRVWDPLQVRGDI